MSEDFEMAPGAETGMDGNVFRDGEGRISPHWLERLRAFLAAERAEDVSLVMAPLHTSDVGDVLEQLDAEERLQLVRLLGDDFDFSALTEVDESIRIEIMEALPNAAIARGVAELDNDDAVYLLEDLEKEDQDEILSALPTFERLSLKRSLDFPEESAGRRMQTDFIAIPPFWTVGRQSTICARKRTCPTNSTRFMWWMPLTRFWAPCRSTSSCGPSARPRSTL
jgi:magnesium transporter